MASAVGGAFLATETDQPFEARPSLGVYAKQRSASKLSNAKKKNFKNTSGVYSSQYSHRSSLTSNSHQSIMSNSQLGTIEKNQMSGTFITSGTVTATSAAMEAKIGLNNINETNSNCMTTNHSIVTGNTDHAKIDYTAIDDAKNRRLQADRLRMQQTRDVSIKCFEFIEEDKEQELIKCLTDHPLVNIHEIVDHIGKTLLHEATFQDTTKILRLLIMYAKQ